RTDYYGVYMVGKRVGWAKVSLVRLDAKSPGFESRREVHLKQTSLGAKIEMHSLETWEFDARPPYAFRGGLSRESDGKSVKETRLARAAEGFDVTIRSGDETVRKKIAAPDYTLEDLAAVYLWIRQGAKQGDTVTAREFDFDYLKVDRETYKLKATKA